MAVSAFLFLYVTYMGFEYLVLTLQKMIDYNIPSFSKTWETRLH